LLDNGTIDTKEAINSIDKKSILKRAEIASVFNKRTEIMFPLRITQKCFQRYEKRVLSYIIYLTSTLIFLLS